MKTRITELLGIEYPVVQGAMARIADGGLAGAVSEAGGLGIIACGGARPEWIREQVARARALTSKPIGINVMLMDPRASEVAELVCELSVEVVTTGAGSPANYMKMWKDAGVKVVPVVASSALAARMERLGADAVVAEGTEAGGHIGELTTMALVPSVCRGGFDPRHRRRRHRGRPGDARRLRAGRRGRAVRHALPHRGGMRRARGVEGEGAESQGLRHHRHRARHRASGARPEEQVRPRVPQDRDGRHLRGRAGGHVRRLARPGRGGRRGKRLGHGRARWRRW